MNNSDGVLVIANEAPVRGDLLGDHFGFNVIDDRSDMPLKCFRFKVFLTERTERVHTEDNLVTVFAKHNREGVELAVKRTDRIDGTTARLRFKEGADIEIFVRF